MGRLVALVGVVLIAGGCSTPAASPAPAPPAVSPSVSPSVSPPVASPPAPPSSCDPWRCPAGAGAASAYLAARPGRIGAIVRDRVTGAVWRGGVTGETTWTASTIKVAIVADLLERHRAGTISLTSTDRANMSAALVDSSNDAAHALWTKYDGPGMLPRFRDRYGMRTLSVVPGYEPYWRHLRCAAEDLVALMSYVLERLPAADRAYLVDKLRGVSRVQRWGAFAAPPALRPGAKAGWAEKPSYDGGGGYWVTHTVGFAGADERYVIAAWYRLPSGSGGGLRAGVQAVSDVVAHLFGAEIPARVSMP